MALNTALFVGLPYAALLVFLVGTIYRYRYQGFRFSSLSSQFLEGRGLFWGAVPFHFGILVCFLGHLIAFLLPQTLLAWNSVPARLIVLEVAGFSFGLSAGFGLLVLIVRRATQGRVLVVSNMMDFAIELLLLAQIVIGLWITLGFRWGSSWFAADLSPYLWSLLKLQPEIGAVSAMPWAIKAHIIGAFLILALFPFTRLVHVLVAPIHYLFRPYQRVIWNWDRKRVRDASTPWSEARPKNN
jgi:nitrate reductase gamma subunit